jgi:hypothetical protein
MLLDTRIAFILVFLAALVVRLPSLVSGLKTDEDASLALHAGHDVRGMYLSWRDHPPANLAAYASGRALPFSESGLVEARLPSLLAGSLTVALVYLGILTPTRSARAAIVPTLFLLFSAEHIHFSTSIRGYGWQTLGTLALHLLYLRYVREPSRASLLPAYALVAVLTLWCHLWGIYVLAAHFLMIGFVPGLSILKKLAFVAAQAVAGALLVMLMWNAIPEILEGNRDAPRTVYLIWLEFWWGFTHNTRYFEVVSNLLPILFWGTTLWSLRRRWTQEMVLSFGVLLLVPALLLVHPPGAFGSRYVLFYVPLVFLFWGLVLAHNGLLPRTWLRWEVRAILIATGLFLVTALTGVFAFLILPLQASVFYLLFAVAITEWDPEVWTTRWLRLQLVCAIVLLLLQWGDWMLVR